MIFRIPWNNHSKNDRKATVCGLFTSGFPVSSCPVQNMDGIGLGSIRCILWNKFGYRRRDPDGNVRLAEASKNPGQIDGNLWKTILHRQLQVIKEYFSSKLYEINTRCTKCCQRYSTHALSLSERKQGYRPASPHILFINGYCICHSV